MIVHKGRQRIFIDVDRIEYFEAYGDYARVFTSNEDFLVTVGLSELERRLPPRHFIRIHRSHLVNLKKAQELFKEGRYFYLKLPGRPPFKVSETYLPRVKALRL